MQVQNSAGYKFIPLTELDVLRQQLQIAGATYSLKGTILLSEEGINISIAGAMDSIAAFKAELMRDSRFADMTFRESFSEQQPFKFFKVKIKKEIITFKQANTSPLTKRAPSISPEQLKQWLDEHRDINLFDTRNDYEVQVGTFTGAINLQVDHFSHLPAALNKIDKHKPTVMFCTGGIRCEKAALHMLNEGFSDVYQLDGGILNYFAKVGGAHYQGDCFVFDERIAVDPNLLPSQTHSKQ